MTPDGTIIVKEEEETGKIMSTALGSGNQNWNRDLTGWSTLHEGKL